MLYTVFLCVTLFVTMFMTALCLLKIPPLLAGRKLKKAVVKKENLGGFLMRLAVTPLVVPVSAFIPMSPVREAELEQQLRRVGFPLTPKEYYARAVIVSAFSLLLTAVIVIMGLPQAAPVTLILSILIFFHCITSHTDALKSKREKIEMGLPGFIRSILYHLPDPKKTKGVKINLIQIFEDYLVVANDVFYFDVAYLITEMKSRDVKTAMRNFDARIGLPEVSFLTRVLIGLDRGEDQGEALSALARDMDLKARENIRRQLGKRPGRVRLATMPLVVVAVATLLYVIVTHLFQSLGGLF